MESRISVRNVKEESCLVDEAQNSLSMAFLGDGNPPNYKGDFHADLDEAYELIRKLSDVTDRMEKNITE